MKAESELMGRPGMTLQTRVRLVCAMRALSGVRESAVHPPTVNTQSKGNAAYPVMVSYWITKRHRSISSFMSCHVFDLLLAGCTFHGKEYPDGTEFASDKDPCGVCYCYGGEVVCTKIPCYGECSHPYKPPGQCCGECERV